MKEIINATSFLARQGLVFFSWNLQTILIHDDGLFPGLDGLFPGLFSYISVNSRRCNLLVYCYSEKSQSIRQFYLVFPCHPLLAVENWKVFYYFSAVHLKLQYYRHSKTEYQVLCLTNSG